MTGPRRLAFALLFAALVPAVADAGGLRPFQSGSAGAIVEARAGRPFILSFWSVDCVHCRAELRELAALIQAHPELEVVLVSTDSPAMAAAVEAVLGHYPLSRAERWIFADDFVERLVFEVDPRWHGELPRSYLHGPGKIVEVVTGRIDPQRMNRWLEATGVVRD